MLHNAEILRVKYLSANNALRHLQRYMYFHLVVGVGFLILMIVGGTALFYEVFDFLMDQAVFGAPLMDKLVGIVFLAFFSMLIFSNLIITLSTSYISKEVDFLMAQPVSHSAIFRQKLIESIIYSSWAFVVLSLPFFIAFGMAREVEWYFYPLAALLIIPYLAIPAILGSIITMIVTAFVPARRSRTLVVALAVLVVLLSFFMARVMGIHRMFAQTDNGDFSQIMTFLEFGSSPMLPSSWMMQGLLSIGPGSLGPPDLRTYVYWLAMLSSTALMLYQVSEWLVGPLYYKGWCLTKDSASRGEIKQHTFSLFSFVDRGLAFLPRQYGTLFSKDLKTFWRDPAQWTQLVILFGLMIIYITNLGSARKHSQTIEFMLTDWKTLLAFFNLGATGFILSILTTRFIYPMLSLEGRQFWSIGLAPMHRNSIVWQKYFFCLSCSLAFSLTILVMSNMVLHVEPLYQQIGFAVTIVMALGLSSLSIGLGALLPNFREDNPARIANGIGGTANALLSMAYIGCTVGLLGTPIHLHGKGILQQSHLWATWKEVYIIAYILMHIVVIFVPMYLGLRKWSKLEF